MAGLCGLRERERERDYVVFENRKVIEVCVALFSR
jgi:hypothetical protein